MARFTELNNDILLEILNHLVPTDIGGRKVSLCSLALTCHTLAEQARPFIFKDVWATVGRLQFDLLQRSLKERPTLALCVRRAELLILSADQETYHQANDFLSQLPRLRTLVLSGYLSKLTSHPTFLSSNSMSELRRIELNFEHVETTAIASFVCLESVEDIAVLCDVGTTLRMPPGFEGSRKKPLQNLEIDTNTGSLPVLEKLLTLAHGTRRLRAFLFADSWCMHLSDITRVLSPAREILEELYLLLGGSSEWVKNNKSVLDLRSFPALKMVDVTSNCFFQGDGPKQDIHQFLPPQLESLKITFPSDSDAITFFSAAGSIMDYRWLLDIALNKRARFPNLEVIDVTELISIRKGPYSFTKSWKQPPDIIGAFQDASIQLTVLLRKIHITDE